ncbi:N-acetyl-gamma-glutamyl-phosphate reductase [Rurimicrobium arvi]|uniref:N-acetyl-gamma-glutamyl-phosphate reductase n=1 Tax=Rurimicrobium arvi TaxID=2049916 RepID=A0ABP8MRF8_9BACT
MNNTMINAGIIGGAGYTGGELLRILLQHPAVQIRFVHSRSHAGQAVSSVHRDLLGWPDIRFSSELPDDVDVLFLCVGHGEAKKWLSEHAIPGNTRIIDLSQDHRWASTGDGRTFCYGLPEANRAAIREAQHIANPGCFATAIQLALLPLAAAQCMQEVHLFGITGATGAGQSLQASSHFSWRSNNIQAYKTLQHQHLYEIGKTLETFQTNVPPINFVPVRGDFARGIYLTAYTRSDWSQEEAMQQYRSFYADHPFTHLSDSPIDLKQSVNTNNCLIYTERVGDKIVIHACIDNLLKGASGQAVQNMNLMFGFEETAGLHLKASAF